MTRRELEREMRRLVMALTPRQAAAAQRSRDGGPMGSWLMMQRYLPEGKERRPGPGWRFQVRMDVIMAPVVYEHAPEPELAPPKRGLSGAYRRWRGQRVAAARGALA